MRMKDLARMAGVAESTVSRALNGKPGVGEATRQRILELARKYNFQPNRLARGLANKGTGILGLMVPDIEPHMYNMMVAGIEKAATERGCRVILAITGREKQKESDYIRFFKQRDVDGVVILGSGLARPGIPELYLAEKPVILVNLLCEELALPSLLLDYHQAGFLAGEYIRDLGYKTAVLFIANSGLFIEQMIVGLQEGAGKGFFLKVIQAGEDSREAGYQSFIELVQAGREPGSLLSTGREITLGIYDAVHDGGFYLPIDFQLLAIDDEPVYSHLATPITAISFPYKEIGYDAAELLIDKITQNADEKDGTTEPFQLCRPVLEVRQSTSRPGPGND
ncbi:MAG: LacI family DNA-binding transcriptional regulator [Halanaerobium sp.]|nr:LacI family DNA-binding transcriptional regulator [Halanaerobium sp.]